MKEWRSVVKNLMVFPSLYGCSYKSIGEYLTLSNTKKLFAVLDEFWDVHKQVKVWQKGIKTELNTNGAIYTPFGRKFRAPLKHNEALNYPPQSTASDLVMAAMVKLAKYSIEYDEPSLAPIMNIHDDLSYEIPENRLDELLPIIIETMISVEGYENWLLVPLEIEVSTGYSWGTMEEIGKYSSQTWEFS
jgi:DNA polymerase-1